MSHKTNNAFIWFNLITITVKYLQKSSNKSNINGQLLHQNTYVVYYWKFKYQNIFRG